MKRWAVLVLSVAACARVRAPDVAPQRTPLPVAASFGRTWDAVIDVFAARNIPIRAVDRASGFIATDRMSVARDPRAGRQPDRDADCGSDILRTPGHPTEATYNVVVRGDSARSTVRVTVTWFGVVAASRSVSASECPSRGVWESEAETDIRSRAEAKR